MKTILEKRINVAIMIAIMVALISTALVVYNNYFNPKTIYMQPSFITDVGDDKNLAGVSDNIFVAKITGQTGTKALSKHPETQYSAEVIENIKGSLKGTITINQTGGHRGSRLYIVKGDNIIEEGKTYLFAARYNAQEDWYTVVPIYGKLIINNDTDNKNLVDRFKKAYKEEIKFE